MKGRILQLGFLLCVTALGVVKPGENILANGELEADQTEYPVGWSVFRRDRKLVTWHPSGGPDARPFFRFSATTAEPHDTTVRQGGLKLATNGLYRISARVRTRDFAYRNGGLIVADGGWRRSAGVRRIPRDTAGKWVELAETFASVAPDGNHKLILFAAGFTGTFEVADVRLTAENDAALAGTEPSAMVLAANTPRFVPIAPLLWEIPKAKREVEFRFFGKVPSGRMADYDLVLTGDGSSRESRVPIATDAIRVPLPEGADHGVLTVRGVDRASGLEMAREQFTFRTVDAPTIPDSCGRRLNNLSMELLDSQLNGHEPQTFSFTAPRSGWLYLAVRRTSSRAVNVALDGRVVIDGGTPRLETFREAAAGPHTIVVDGARDGRLVVRAIAEIFAYCPGVNNSVREGPRYDWPYEERHTLPAVTTLNGGRIPEEELSAFHARGYRWIANLNTTGISAAALEKALAACSGLTASAYDGVSCDEQFFYNPQAITAYRDGLKSYDFAHSPMRVIYTWIVGKPLTPSLGQSFIATCINASRGRGKLLMEMYCRTRGETEEEARDHLRHYVSETLDRYRAWHPLSVASAGVVFGNFNQMPVLTLAHHPAVDYKYYLDMQLNLAANDPSCRDLGVVGYWGGNYADDEMRRWSFALMRHYVVEGRTNMLSAAYGYRYNPGHVRNGDFDGALDPWRATGDVRTDSHLEFAGRSQCRWGGNGGVGDTFAVLTRQEGAPATLAQTARGLTPGRDYCLQFATFDVTDVKAHRIAPRRFGIDVKLGAGAAVKDAASWVHVDRRTKGRYDFNNNVARINLHHLVFTARAEETEIVFDNAAAKVGEVLGINAVSLNPYFAGSAGDGALTSTQSRHNESQ